MRVRFEENLVLNTFETDWEEDSEKTLEMKQFGFEKLNRFALQKARGFESSKKGFESPINNFEIFRLLQRDSNPRKRDSNRLKTIELLEIGFEYLKQGFESPKNVLATGKQIRIAQRGIRIA